MCSTLLIKLSGSNRSLFKPYSTERTHFFASHFKILHVSITCVLLPLSPVPSAPPAGLTAFNVVPTSFIVQWETVPCIQRNGDITGYSVRYGVLGNGGMETLTMVGSDILMTNLTGLVPDTSYLVQVAGVNGQGVGVYGEITVTTPQS